jgi:hypothetical protein
MVKGFKTYLGNQNKEKVKMGKVSPRDAEISPPGVRGKREKNGGI